MTRFPLLPVTTVGSWPRPPELLRAQSLKRRGQLAPEAFDELADGAVRRCLDAQHEAEVDVVTDGEQRRDNFYSFVAEKLDGVRLMTLLDLLDYVEDREGFERLLRTLDVPASSLSTPVCVGRISRRSPLAGGELSFLKAHTAKPVKITLPGPYLLTRAMWVRELTRGPYASKEELSEDVVRLLRLEVEELVAGGADVVQLDEPVLTEIVFAPNATRTFMCASLAARGDPSEELELAVSLINRVLSGVTGAVRALHICRGNWSPDESRLLSGDYAPLAPYLERLEVDQLVLEYATERAGDLHTFGDKALGLGVVNPRTPDIETPEAIAASVRRALKLYPPDRLWLNPDCGFGTFSRSPVAAPEVAKAKLRAMAAAARAVRAEIGG
ncbi:MAG: cobalamin-independent methionine synthase II family protein [Acidobacteria bacterium]|nr:cobalamin-independent methionine synthase II family protein [Acidobacteriota bacterium]